MDTVVKLVISNLRAQSITMRRKSKSVVELRCFNRNHQVSFGVSIALGIASAHTNFEIMVTKILWLWNQWFVICVISGVVIGHAQKSMERRKICGGTRVPIMGVQSIKC